nr:hypothetical protein BaRGS_013648 [Batillaria attramentaria]
MLIRYPGSSWLYAAMLLANDAIGAGLLHFPKAFRDAGGVMISVVVQMVLMVFIVLAFFILVYGSDVNNSATYQDTIHAVCGKGAWVACSGCIFLYCFGLSLTLLIIIGDQWQQCCVCGKIAARQQAAEYVCVFIYTVTATLGYLTFGDRVTSDILLSYRPDVVVLIAVIFTAVKSYTTYPIFLFCGSLRGSTSESETEFQERLRRVSVSSLWFFITLLLAVFIPDLGVVIQMLGSLAAVFIFVFPGVGVQTCQPITTKLAMNLEGHLGENIG